MTTTRSDFKLPPRLCRKDGAPRRVGFELEFSGLSIDQTAAVLQSTLGGQLHRKSAAERELRVDGLGSFNIELDWDFLKRRAAQADADGGANQRDLMDLLSAAATLVVPLEVVCPPIPMNAMNRLDAMVVGLREAGAVGTDESPLAAYGVHINPELGDLEASNIFTHLRAFGLLQWWLAEAHQVDLARRISPYIDFYPEDYVKLLAKGERRSLDQIFADYLDHNATRNRALDLLPLLAEIDAERVRAQVDDAKIKARPTFHYRLPNCHLEQAGWSLASAWNVWVVVEQLAERGSDLDQLGSAFARHWRPLLGLNRASWLEFVDQWLRDRGLA